MKEAAEGVEAAFIQASYKTSKKQGKSYFGKMMDDLNGGEEQVSHLTAEDFKAAMEEVKESGYKPSAPLPSVNTPQLQNSDGYDKARKLSEVVPNAYSSEHQHKCPLSELCDHIEALSPYPIVDIVIHLNDHHEWNRKEIAGWLDTLDVDLSLKKPDENEEGGE